jgi:hypothetical protein
VIHNVRNNITVSGMTNDNNKETNDEKMTGMHSILHAKYVEYSFAVHEIQP